MGGGGHDIERAVIAGRKLRRLLGGRARLLGRGRGRVGRLLRLPDRFVESFIVHWRSPQAAVFGAKDGCTIAPSAVSSVAATISSSRLIESDFVALSIIGSTKA